MKPDSLRQYTHKPGFLSTQLMGLIYDPVASRGNVCGNLRRR